MATNPMLDILVWLRTQLLTDSEITAFVGSGTSARIYAGQMPTDKTYTSLIVMNDLQGDNDKDIPLQKPTVQLRIYGNTMLNARELYRDVHSAIHGIQFQGDDGECIIPMESGTGQLLMDPVLDKPWWYMLAFYECVLRYNTQ